MFRQSFVIQYFCVHQCLLYLGFEVLFYKASAYSAQETPFEKVSKRSSHIVKLRLGIGIQIHVSRYEVEISSGKSISFSSSQSQRYAYHLPRSILPQILWDDHFHYRIKWEAFDFWYAYPQVYLEWVRSFWVSILFLLKSLTFEFDTYNCPWIILCLNTRTVKIVVRENLSFCQGGASSMHPAQKFYASDFF